MTKEISLLNPLKMYYPDYFKDIPNDEEQFSLLSRYRELLKIGTEEEINEVEKSFQLLNEMLEKRDYFDGVRNILNQLLSGKEPTDIFSNMFPSTRNQIEIFRSQFTDACDIVLHKDEIEWDKMQLPWYEYKNEYGLAGSISNYELKINWNMDYWTQDAKNLLLKFWRDRYSKTILFMSPAKLPAGGVGFFDSEYESTKLSTYKFVFSESHKINIDYHKRVKLLKEEFLISQPVDQYRLMLLIEAERLCWKMWKEKNTFLIKEGDPINYISRVKNKNEQNEIAFKEAFAQLIEYDREMGLPITDPDRDFKGAEPINVAEYKKWLTRNGRVVSDDSDESMYLKNLEKKDQNAKVKPLKFSFVPMLIEEYVNEQARNDRQDEIVRNSSGQILSIKGVKQINYLDKDNKISIDKTGNKESDLLRVKSVIEQTIEQNKNGEPKAVEEVKIEKNVVIEAETSKVDQVEINKEAESLAIPEDEVFKDQDDLLEKFSNVLSKIDDVAKEKEEIEKRGFIVIDPNKSKTIPKGNPYLALLEDSDYQEKDEDRDIKENFDIKLIENNEMKKEEVDLIVQSSDEQDLIYEKMLIKLEDEENKDQDQGSASSDEKPMWIKEGMLATEEDRKEFNRKRKQYKERKSRIKTKTIKVFDRNKQLEKIKSEWKKFPPTKSEGGFLEAAKNKVINFKNGAKNLWDKRIKFNVDGKDEQKMSFLQKISSKINADRKNKYEDSIDVENIAVYETEVKKRKKYKM